jgi:hypothetical protein
MSGIIIGAPPAPAPPGGIMSIGFGGNIIPGGPPPPPREGIIIPPGGGIIIPRGGIPGCFISKGLCGCALLPNGGKEDPLPPELI